MNSSILSVFCSDEQISYLRIPEKKYRIHITNLPSNIDVEFLSTEFEWDIYDIVMDPSASGQALPTQCWLKNAINEREVDDSVKRWNKKAIKGSIIQCDKEEDELELCNKFQYGRCPKSSDDCHWEHVPCTAQDTCSSTCPYGHKFGIKSECNSPKSKSNIQLIKYSNRILKIDKDGILCPCCQQIS